MTQYHQKAIELKYSGHTYKEIEKALGGKMTDSTLKNYFAEDGMLFVPYLAYEAKQNKWAEEHSRQEHKRLSAFTAKIRSTILKQALKSKDFRLVLDIVKDIDDRAGNVVVRKTEVKEERKPIETYEEYVAECTRLGVDPRTGFPPGAKQMGKN